MTPHDNLESELKRRTRFQRLLHLASCESTQDVAKDNFTGIDGSESDGVVWADHQTQGRGRQQRVWDDESGLDLAVTFCASLRLPNPVALPAALPVAVLRACEAASGEALRIKWPNDVYAGSRKLSGVLVDRDSARPDTFRIGCGVNVNRVAFPDELAGTATSLRLLRGRPLDRGALLLSLAEQVDEMLTAIGPDGDHAGHVETFRARLGLLGQQVEGQAGADFAGELTSIDFEQLVLDGRRAIPLAVVTRLAPRRG